MGDNNSFLSAGPTLGALVLASTVTVIILLGAFESDEPTHQQTYLTQYHLLHLYETFLVSLSVGNTQAITSFLTAIVREYSLGRSPSSTPHFFTFKLLKNQIFIILTVLRQSV